MIFESIVDWLSWYQEWYNRFIVEHPARWARLMESIEWAAAAEENMTGDLDAL